MSVFGVTTTNTRVHQSSQEARKGSTSSTHKDNETAKADVQEIESVTGVSSASGSNVVTTPELEATEQAVTFRNADFIIVN